MSEQTTIWHHQAFPSGTQIVTSMQAGEPHYYVYGPAGGNEADDGNRYKMCEEFCAYMNGGPRPVWMDDMYRANDETIRGLDQSSIFACGPMIDKDPPNLWWVHDDSPAAKAKRKALIDRLVGM